MKRTNFWDKKKSSNIGQPTWPSDIQQKMRTWRIVDFTVLADHRINLKESVKGNEYQALARELKKTMK